MECLRYISIVFVLLAFQACTSRSQCTEMKGMRDAISDKYSTAGEQPYRKCWKIEVPANHFIELSAKFLEIYEWSTLEKCNLARIKIDMDGEEILKICSKESAQKPMNITRDHPITLEVEFFVDSAKYSAGRPFSFELHYYIYAGILEITDIEEARSNAVNWLKSKDTPFWAWKDDTPRAVTALYLSGGVHFNGMMLEDMMAKHTDLRVALGLTWSAVTSQQLSTFINGLLATCHNPRRFYGHNLVKRLKDQVESSNNFTHPTVYLSLCNANETWPLKSTKDLSNILGSKSEQLFVRDFQAFAIMALSCLTKRTNFLNKEENADLKSLYTKSINKIKNYQQTDGTFGNIYTTSLLTQALLSAGQESAQDWNLTATMQYLIKELNQSNVDFLTIYNALPILNKKSLIDIATVNCSENPRRNGDEDLVDEMNEYQGEKIRVQYTLYIGDQKDIIHTISLRVPTNSTAYKVMQVAVTQDSKYQFKVKIMSGKMYIFEIANTLNDPEAGKFWLLHLKSKDAEEALPQSTSNPDQIILNDEDELIMWYKTAQI